MNETAFTSTPSASLSRWTALWRTLDCEGDPAPWHRRLVSAYAESHRHYHNGQHLDECLTELDASRSLASAPHEVELALWFHDAVYDPKSKTNEEDSADLAVACLTAARLPTSTVEHVRQLILVTKTHRPGLLRDAALLIDLDLSILGKSRARFWTYEQAIRDEYRWVPVDTYREKRAEVLAHFLARPSIYATDTFRQKYEAAARTNLAASLEKLRLSPS